MKAIAVLVILAGLTAAQTTFAQSQTAAQQRVLQEKLTGAKDITCTFPLLATGTWTKEGEPQAEVKMSAITLKFTDVNVEEATAQMTSNMGTYDLIVRLADTALHFIHAYRTGPLYTTSIFTRESTPGSGRFKAVHSRHEYTEVMLPGFTSRPEQYYGECQVVR